MTLNDIHLIFSTLWSKISQQHCWDIERSMNDFRVIKHNGHFFSSDQYNQLHADSLAFVESELDIKLPHLRKVVVTHHVPTYYHYPEQYRGSILADAFTVELFDLIERTKPEFGYIGTIMSIHLILGLTTPSC